MIEGVALAGFVALLVWAAVSDARRLIIPNWVSIALAAIYPLAALAVGAPLTAVGMHVLFGLAVLAVGFFLFAGNIIGGGDAKLMAATAVWAGSEAFFVFFFWTVVAGGLMALALLGARQLLNAVTTPPFVSHLLKKQNGIPYGVAIMVGGLMALPSIPYLTASLTLP